MESVPSDLSGQPVPPPLSLRAIPAHIRGKFGFPVPPPRLYQEDSIVRAKATPAKPEDVERVKREYPADLLEMCDVEVVERAGKLREEYLDTLLKDDEYRRQVWAAIKDCERRIKEDRHRYFGDED